MNKLLALTEISYGKVMTVHNGFLLYFIENSAISICAFLSTSASFLHHEDGHNSLASDPIPGPNPNPDPNPNANSWASRVRKQRQDPWDLTINEDN